MGVQMRHVLGMTETLVSTMNSVKVGCLLFATCQSIVNASSAKALNHSFYEASIVLCRQDTNGCIPHDSIGHLP